MSTRLAQMLWGSCLPPVRRQREAAAVSPGRAGIEPKPEHSREVLDEQAAAELLRVTPRTCGIYWGNS